jgi:oligopeptide transport system substrate-binding protein
MKQLQADTPSCGPLWIVLLLLPLLLANAGCRPLLTALGSSSTDLPTATATWPPSPTATPTVIPPTMLATSTPTLVTPPRPTPALMLTPTPTAGYYGDPTIGFSFFYPSDWDVEERDTWMVAWSDQPHVWVGGHSSLMDAGDRVEDYITNLAGDPDKLQVVADATTSLWDGMPARVLEFDDTENSRKLRATFVTRGRRVFVVLIVAPAETFDRYPQTLEAIAASMRIEEPRPYGLSRRNALFLWGSQPHTLDPATTLAGAGSEIGAIFSGLVMLDENLQVVPDLAERWEVSDDGSVYTFYLRSNAFFHNGKPVTAHDVKFSWERAADPATGSNTVETYLGDIVGVKAKFRGEADEISGVEVVDDHTLRVTIDAPKVYFPAKLTSPVAFVVDKENVREANWEHHPNGTGPFHLSTWEDDRLLILERNDRFYLEPARLEHVVFMMYAGQPMWMYESDEIDMVGVATYELERVTDPTDPLNADLHISPNLCTSRLVLDVTRPPFDDLLVRQAFAHALDRQKLSDVVLKGRAQPAHTILPPGMPGYSQDIHTPGFDPERARELLAASPYGGPDGLPEIVLNTSGQGGDLSDYEVALVDMWRTHLGVEVTVEQFEPEQFAYEVHKHHGQIILLGWCADYPDPEIFLDVLYHSDSQENLGGYSNPELDRLLELARVETDVVARMQGYQQIEQMIIDDVPDIQLHRSQSYVLVKPWVKNYLQSPIGLALEWRILSVERPNE